MQNRSLRERIHILEGIVKEMPRQHPAGQSSRLQVSTRRSSQGSSTGTFVSSGTVASDDTSPGGVVFFDNPFDGSHPVLNEHVSAAEVEVQAAQMPRTRSATNPHPYNHLDRLAVAQPGHDGAYDGFLVDAGMAVAEAPTMAQVVVPPASMAVPIFEHHDGLAADHPFDLTAAVAAGPFEGDLPYAYSPPVVEAAQPGLVAFARLHHEVPVDPVHPGIEMYQYDGIELEQDVCTGTHDAQPDAHGHIANSFEVGHPIGGYRFESIDSPRAHDEGYELETPGRYHVAPMPLPMGGIDFGESIISRRHRQPSPRLVARRRRDARPSYDPMADCRASGSCKVNGLPARAARCREARTRAEEAWREMQGVAPSRGLSPPQNHQQQSHQGGYEIFSVC